jgi:hypothetical protein
MVLWRSSSNNLPRPRLREKKYDWRVVEARINTHLKMFTLPITEAGEDLTIHFVHHRSSHPDAIPLLFQHGWPGSFLEVDKIIDSLTNPEPGQQAYHVVAPSLPGFVFSTGPKGSDFILKNMAAADHKLMHALGYAKYMDREETGDRSLSGLSLYSSPKVALLSMSICLLRDRQSGIRTP